MDIFAHGLWTGAGYRFVNQKLGEPEKRKRLNIRLAVAVKDTAPIDEMSPF